jgi:hypothetical protein
VTRPITGATLIEVAGIVSILVFTVKYLDMIGAIAAAIALLAGRLFANGYLFIPCYTVLKRDPD